MNNDKNSFEKKGTFNSMAHQRSPTKAQMQKAETNKVLLLPNAEYIIVLLSLPFYLSIAARATLQKYRSNTHCGLLWIHT